MVFEDVPGKLEKEVGNVLEELQVALKLVPEVLE